MKSANLILFTDLDGTLLDHDTYSYCAAKEALNLVREACLPLIFCSSKTRAEIEVWRERLGNNDPFICENGGAVFFSDALNPPSQKHIEKNGYQVIELGIPHADILKRFNTLKNKFGDRIKGFSELDVEELMDWTGLPYGDVMLAKEREYTEPFIFDGNETDKKELGETIRDLNLNLTRGGRFHCLMGNNDKGKAVNIIATLYKEDRPGLITVALGDSYNDLPMLKVVDIPILVQKPGGLYENEIDLPNLHRAPGVGPIGWNKALLTILSGRGKTY